MAKAVADVLDDDLVVVALNRRAFEKLTALAESKGMTFPQFLDRLIEEGDGIEEAVASAPQLLLG